MGPSGRPFAPAIAAAKQAAEWHKRSAALPEFAVRAHAEHYEKTLPRPERLGVDRDLGPQRLGIFAAARTRGLLVRTRRRSLSTGGRCPRRRILLARDPRPPGAWTLRPDR